MDDRTARLEGIVEELRLTILSLQQRVDLLESNRPVAAAAEDATRAHRQAESAAKATRNPYDPIAILSLVGRLFLVLAGAFFLRAMTESGVLPPPIGLSIGFAYGLLWLFFADRSGARRQVPSAVFHAAGTAMVAFPLLVEAVTKFKVLHGPGSVIAVSVLTVALLLVAWHQRLRAIGWITVLGALPTSAVLMSQTGAVAEFACFLIALGMVTLWFGYSLDWWGLRWPTALAADVAVVGVTLRVLAPEQPYAPQVAMLLQLLLLGAYVLSIATRTLVRGRNVVPFEVAQTAAALVVGFGGALYLAQVTGILPATIGVISLALGAACYGVAVVFLDRRKDKGGNVYYYTTLALVHVIAGFILVLGEPWLGIVLAVLSVIAAALWARLGRSFMLVHAAAYLLAAGIASGALLYCLTVLASAKLGPWSLPGVAVLAVSAAGAAAAWLAASRRSATGEEILSGLRLVIILVFFAAVTATVVGYAGPLVGRMSDGTVNPGVLATVTTVVLSVATLLTAWGGRQARFREWSWLVYPLLITIGLKMAAQDFKYSRPSTLFIAMALFGAALIVAPRLRRAGA